VPRAAGRVSKPFLLFPRARARKGRKAFIHAGFQAIFSFPNSVFFRVSSVIFRVYLSFSGSLPQFCLDKFMTDIAISAMI